MDDPVGRARLPLQRSERLVERRERGALIAAGNAANSARMPLTMVAESDCLTFVPVNKQVGYESSNVLGLLLDHRRPYPIRCGANDGGYSRLRF